MKIAPRPKRGDTNSLRPGLIFWNMLRGEEWWVTPEKFEHKRRVKNANARKLAKTPEGRLKNRVASRARSKLPHIKEKAAAYQRKMRHIFSPRQRERRRAYKKMRMATDPHYRLAAVLSERMRQAIRVVKGKKHGPTQTLIGCTHEFFRGWLESQFVEPMNWTNYGKLWVVDHIRPVVGFDLLTEEGQLAAFHYTNCAPMFWSENSSKCDRIEFEGRIVRAGHLRKKNIIPFTA